MYEIFPDLSNLMSSTNIYVKKETLHNMKSRKKHIDNVEKTSTYIMCDYYTNGKKQENKKYVYEYLKLDEMKILNTDTLGIEKVELKNTTDMMVKMCSKSTLYYDNNKNSYCTVIGNGTYDGFGYGNVYIVVYRDKKLEGLDVNVDLRKNFYKVAHHNNNYYMKFNNEIYKLSNLYEIKMKIIIRHNNEKLLLPPFEIGVNVVNVDNLILKKCIVKNNELFVHLECGGEIFFAKRPVNFEEIVSTEIQYEYMQNIMSQYEGNEMNVEKFDEHIPYEDDDDILLKIYETIFSYKVSTAPLTLLGKKNQLYKLISHGRGVVNRNIITGYKMLEFPKNLNNSVIFSKAQKDGYFQFPYRAGKIADSPVSIIYHNKNYFIYQRANPLNDARNIEFSQSNDLQTWEKFKLISIKNSDVTNDNYYLPNIMKYGDTNYLICITPYYDHTYKTNHSYRIILSKNGIDFDILSDIYIFPDNVDHHIFFPCPGGINIEKECMKLYFMDIAKNDLVEYITEPYGLFNLRTDDLGRCMTKLLKVDNNKIKIGYKCDKGGYIKIRLIDTFNNVIDDHDFKDFDTLNNVNFTDKILSWEGKDEINNNHVKMSIEMCKADIYYAQGEFIENPTHNYYTHLIFKAVDYIAGRFSDLKDEYINIDFVRDYNSRVKCILGEIFYDESHSKAFVKVQLEDCSIIKITVYDACEDLILKMDNSDVVCTIPDEKKHIVIKYIEAGHEGMKEIKKMIDGFYRGNRNINMKKDINDIDFVIYQRPICIFDYKLINVPQ